jgi:GntR family transcriptional regulator
LTSAQVSYLDHVDEIDHDGPVPKYQQLANLLRAGIESGQYPEGRPVPTERMLTQTFGIAVGTVKKAIGVLRDEGLVYTVSGRGVFVGRPPGSPASSSGTKEESARGTVEGGRD